MEPFSGGFCSYKSKFNDCLIALTSLLTTLFRMALRGNLAGAKKQHPAHWLSKIVLPPLTSSASKAKNICSYTIKNAIARLSIRYGTKNGVQS